MDIPRCWLIISLLIVVSFFCSASETAFTCCNRFKFQIKADEGSRTAKAVLKVCNQYDRALTTVLIGNNIAAIIASSLSTLVFLEIFKNAGLDNEAVSLISSILMSLLLYIFGDSFPKTIVKLIPDTMSVILVWPVYILMILLFPITVVFDGFSKLLNKLFKAKADDTFTEEDFENVVEKVSDEGLLEEEQSEIIQSALEFVDTNVKEVFTPKEKMFALNIRDIDRDKLHSILLNTRYSRIPVYDREFDNIIGVLNVKIYFKEFSRNNNVSIRKILQKPYFVSSNIMIDDLFNGFKKNHSHLALVKDNKKHVIGMVTMEDVLEELVSDISEPSALVKGGNR